MIVRRLPSITFALVAGVLIAATVVGTSVNVMVLVATVVFVLAYGAVGALVASRLPRHPIGWLLLAASASFAGGGLLLALVERSQSPDPRAVLGGNWLFGIGVVIASTFILLLFPDGHLPSPGWWAVAWIAAFGGLMVLIGVTLSPDPFEGLPTPSPYALPRDDLRLLLVEGGGLALVAIGILGSIGSLIARWFKGNHKVRQQLMWVVFAVIIVAFGILGMYFLELANGTADLSDNLENSVSSFSLTLVPIAIGIGILRYRLFDIDRIITRTVSYALVVGALGLVVLALVTLLAGFLPSDDPLVVGVSTMAAAALFNPVRRRVQAGVDHQFHRSRYDAQWVIERFTETLRKQVDPDQVVDDWVEAVEGTMKPAAVGVWIRE